MKSYNQLIVSTFILVGTIGILHADEISANSSELVSKMTVNDDDQALMRCRFAINSDKTISEQTRMALRIKYLVVAHQYLKNRSMPAGQIVSNPPRLDGGIPGGDPSRIKDPVMRAKYMQELQKNEELIQAKSKYFILMQSRYEITKLLSTQMIEKTVTPEIVAGILYRSTRTPEEAKELMSIIDQAIVAANQQPLPWPDAP